MLEESRYTYLKGSGRSSHARYHHIPMDEFLFSRLGTPWDDVYSEFSAVFRRKTRSYVSYRFFSDLDWRVERNCWVGAKTGKVYRSTEGEVLDGFYVHPLTGLLCYAGHRERWRRRSVVAPGFIKIDEKTAYAKIDGIWYLVDWAWVKSVDFRGRVYSTSERVYSNKQQLNTKELRTLGLFNAAA